MSPERSTDIDGVVLVHGGYHGAWCWDDVVPQLHLPTVAVDLPGRGRRPIEPGTHVTFGDCAAAVLEDADAAGFERFVLVGHSLGGMTLTTTANRAPERLARLVYVGALALPPGSAVFELLAPDLVGADPTGVQQVLPAEVSRAMFCGDLDDDAFAAAEARLVPEPTGLFVEPVSGYDHGVPATYVRCTRDAVVTRDVVDGFLPHLHPEEVLDLESDHDAMLSHPSELADLLNEVIDRS